MKIIDEIFEELQNDQNSELKLAWEEVQKEIGTYKKIAVIICLIIDLLIIIFMPSSILFGIFLNIIIIALCSQLNRFSPKGRNFISKYKNIVIKKILNNFYTNLEYFPNKSMPDYIYNEARYNESYNRFYSDDYLEAQINNNNNIQMAEVKTVEERTYRDSKGERKTERITKFHGLFAKISIEKSINSELRIMKNGMFFLQKSRLKMDSSEFEKYFDVQATNPIIGMQLLTADVMEELIEFENKTKMKFDISIYNNNIYLRFHCGEMFEPKKIKNGAINKEEIQKYFYMVNFTYNLSNKLITLINETEI